ncbi:MAG: hydroxylamine reductase [Cyanobacteria bacterium SZAS LIN-2]|nr:hydroxylamine reductase [Cyanobacteria bacterium SZAS LIN-3]MBS1994870.1 hydroxylamine reductase [Cyanobacteria bacterium SZAS LIN-2]
MFCYQCEQTSQGTGCNSLGVCGKSPTTARLQDLMVNIVKGISIYADAARKLGATDKTVNDITLEALFMTLTNVNFDEHEHVAYVQRLAKVRDMARTMYVEAAKQKGVKVEEFSGAAVMPIPQTEAEMLSIADAVGILVDISKDGADKTGLRELLIYGVKGMAAYAHHAAMLGYRDEAVFAFVHHAMSESTRTDITIDELLALCLETGKVNFAVMELLDKAHTERLGHPVPTSVKTSHVAGKCLLISGHDMNTLLELLKQTEGKGINVYTHGEMLPAHSYPELKKFKHLVGNYGTAWQNQVAEFAAFPGPILMTTNCLKPPAETYKQRLFSIDVVGFEGVKKITENNFAPIIEAALQCEGFKDDQPETTTTIGFGRQAVLGVADKIVEAVKAGAIKHFFLIGGCDGAEFSRNYFTEIAEQVPQDCVILTLGCGKYRFNHLQFGEIAGLPRLLDVGQCNDAYSAVIIASALAQAFDCTINELPLSLIISWFEQKAVAVLLTLLHLGVKKIKLGPNLPAFITPSVLQVLVNAYEISPVTRPDKDLAAILSA